MTRPDDRLRGTPVPTGRANRLLRMGGIAAGIAGGVASGGLRRLVSGQRPGMADLLLTPANALRLTDGLAQMRGAALKMGQMLSMDTGVVLSPELTAILARLRDDARHMPPKQLQGALNAQWGEGWRKRFAAFDVRPFAAASIGQVHRATTHDGRDLAIKVQYPGVRASIDSDVDNIAGLMRLPGLLPRGMDIAPLLAAAKQQLHEEADYSAEAAHLRRFGDLLAGSKDFIVPQVQEDFSTDAVLAMTYLAADPIDMLVDAPQDIRDRAARDLIDLVLRELFTFGAMQTDPNLANYRVDRATGRIVLLDFGAVRGINPAQQATFHNLMNAGLDDDSVAIRQAMLDIGYFGTATPPQHQDLIQAMFDTAMVPLRQDAPFDFGATDLLERLRDIGMVIGNDRDLMHVPPAETLFLHRKIGGMYLLATKLRARVNLRALLDTYRTGPQNDDI
ncbi:MAG: AarF/ABC1/UbiB kinase family protein [Proteobacteria bacterium]|nr:AarF/ABC1/UbiB kinase family protein [Pseudomonadota bacterium]